MFGNRVDAEILAVVYFVSQVYAWAAIAAAKHSLMLLTVFLFFA